MSTREITIAGLILSVNLPYAEGHVVTAAEAKALNQTRCENISNAMRKRIQELASEDGTFTSEAVTKAQEMVAAYDAEYTFTLGGTGARSAVDPLERECISIARKAIAAKLKEAGVKVKDYPADKLEAAIEAAKDHPEIVKLAKQSLKGKQSLSSILSAPSEAA